MNLIHLCLKRKQLRVILWLSVLPILLVMLVYLTSESDDVKGSRNGSVRLLNDSQENTFFDISYNSLNDSILKNIDIPFRAVEVLADGSFLKRVRIFNKALDVLRNETLASRGSAKWRNISQKREIQLLFTTRDDFLEVVGNFSQLRLVMLPWLKTSGTGVNWSSLNDTSNLVIQNYYEWTADDPLCTWIETPGTIKMKYDVTYNRTCCRDMRRSITPQSLKILAMNSKPLNMQQYWPNNGNAFPQYFYTEQPPFAFYMYIVHDGIVTEHSDVYSGNVKLVQYACNSDTRTDPSTNINKIPLYDEVFPIAQYWGTQMFHRMVEVIPRISLYLEFLKRNPSIRILVPETGGRTAELLNILGIDPSRLIKGPCRANIVYLPRSSMCGFASIQESQVLSLIYRNYITSMFPVEPRNKVVLIRRSHSRRFTEQSDIEKVVAAAAKAYNLDYVMFIDNPAPSLHDIMRMFHSAVMVVGPHGAGLANVIFSKPGTYVIEGVCNLPHVNFCFQRLSYVLGHRWHGIPSRGGCEGVVDVSADAVKKAVVGYLQQTVG